MYLWLVTLGRLKKDPLVPQPSASEAEMAIGKLQEYKSPGTDQIQTEIIKP